MPNSKKNALTPCVNFARDKKAIFLGVIIGAMLSSIIWAIVTETLQTNLFKKWKGKNTESFGEMPEYKTIETESFGEMPE